MNKIFLSLGYFVILIALSGSAQISCSPDIVSYWKFDDGSGILARDSVNANNGTLVNEPVWTSGKVGGALSFDGIDDYVNAGNDTSLDLQDFTVTFWIKTMQTTVGYIVTKWVSGIPQQNYMCTIRRATGNLGCWIYDGTNLPVVDAATFIQNGEWHHIAFVRDTSTDKIYLYVDGNLEAMAVDTTTGTIVTPANLIIGRKDPYYFNGTIDEVAIYKRILSASEIRQHYQNGLNGLGYCEVSVKATIDINPDTLNLNSSGKWITAYIELPEGYDVEDINASTVQLNGVQAVADPKYDFVTNQSGYIIDNDEDGILERMVKFVRSAVAALLSPGDEVELTVNGSLNDGTSFEGTDTIRVIEKG